MVVDNFSPDELKHINVPQLRNVYKYLTGNSGARMRKQQLIDAIIAEVKPKLPTDPLAQLNPENMSVRVRRIYEAKLRGEQL